MSRKASTPVASPDTTEQVPDRLELVCSADNIALEAAADDGGEAIPRFTMVAYSGEPMRIEGTVHDQRGHPAPGIFWVRVFPGIRNGRRDEPRLRGPEYADP